MQWLRKALVGVVLIMAAACTSDRIVEPSTDQAGGPQLQTEAWCQENPDLCNSGNPNLPTDPDPTLPGYFLGSGVSRTKCFHSAGTGINDADYDGMHDYCENMLATAFSPLLVSSPYDGAMGMESYYAVKYFPADLSLPDGGEGSIVRIFYALGYYLDNGSWQSHVCNAGEIIGGFGTLAGYLPDWSIGPLPIANKDQCDGHVGDSEFITVDVRYNELTLHWETVSMFTSAHWMQGNDHSRTTYARPKRFQAGIEFRNQVNGYPTVYVAMGKHANYASVELCEEGTIVYDLCQGNSDQARVRTGNLYNLGSGQANFINQGSCTVGGELVQWYPENYRIECFWTSQRFAGWDKNGPGVTPYSTELLMHFECFSYTITTRLPSLSNPFLWPEFSCSRWGVNRKTGRVS